MTTLWHTDALHGARIVGRIEASGTLTALIVQPAVPIKPIAGVIELVAVPLALSKLPPNIPEIIPAKRVAERTAATQEWPKPEPAVTVAIESVQPAPAGHVHTWQLDSRSRATCACGEVRDFRAKNPHGPMRPDGRALIRRTG